MPFPNLSRTLQGRAIKQASANTESNKATVTKTYADTLGNITAADVKVKGQVATLTQVANASNLKLSVGDTVEVRFLNGSSHSRQITGPGGASTAAAAGAATAANSTINGPAATPSSLDSSPVLLQSASNSAPSGYVEVPGANVYFTDTPPGTTSGGTTNGQRLLTARPLVATSLPNPLTSTLPDGMVLDLVDSYGNSLGMYRLDALAKVWRRRDLGGAGAGFSPGAVQAPVSVGFDHADYAGGAEYITWRAKNTAAYAAGAIEFYGWQTSPDNATWTTEAFGGDTYQGIGLTGGNQYARARAYPLVTSGATPTPSGWVTSAAQTYAVSPTGSTGTTISVVTTLPTPSTSTDNNFYVVRQSGAKDLLYLGAHNAVGGSRFASIALAFYLNKMPLSGLTSALAMNWLCDSGSGNTLVDAQGVANLTTSATGIWGTDATAPSAYNPSGSQYASVSSTTALSGTGSFSFEAAFYDAEDSLQRFLFTMPSSGSAEALRIFRYTDNRWYVDMQTSGATLFRATSSSPVAAGLTHLLVTYNAGTNLLSLYLNGSLAGSVTYSGTRQAFTGFQLAADQVSNPGTKYWTGNIYFARVYTADESANAAAMFANL